MKVKDKYDKLSTGFITGLALPLLTAVIMYMLAKGEPSLSEWLRKIADAGIISKIITLCVIPNVIIFVIFNYFDMVRATRGVLGITFAWAVLVFGEKLIV